MGVLMLFSKISVSGKLALSSLAFTVPIAVMALFIVNGMRYDARFSEKEADGVRYLRPLVELLVRVPAFSRRAVSETSGAEDDAAGIEAAFDALDELQLGLGESLAVTAEKLADRGRMAAAPEALRAAWNTVRAAKGRESEALVAGLRQLIVHVGDYSNLILDPDLDTYYLMDVALLALPDSIGRLNAEVSAEKADDAERAIFLRLHSDIDLARIELSSRTALDEDRNFLGTDAALQSMFPGALEKYLATSRRLHEPGAGTGSVYERSVEACIRSSLEYWVATADSLERLLRTRVRAQESRLLTASIAAAVATAFAYLVVLVIARNLLTQIKALRVRVSAIASKDLRMAEASDSQDELGATAKDLAVLTTGLNWSLSAFRDAVKKMEGSSVEVSTSSARMSESSGELASTIEQIAATLVESEELMGSIRRSVERQIDAVERTTDSLDESGKSLRTVVLSMDGLRAMATESDSAAAAGSASVRGLIERSESLGEKSRALAFRIERIKDASIAIGAMAETISDVAQRTELLAMNASIEAAHAGASGKGFAVVAASIRELASSTSNALESIREGTDSIDATVSEAVATSRETGDISRGLGKNTADAKAALERITATTGQIIRGMDEAAEAVRDYERRSAAILSDAVALKDFSGTIRSAVAEQESGSKETMNSIRLLRENSLRNAESSESLARLSVALKASSRELDAVIGQYVLEDSR
ncbi:MAG TPA: hypothetical protein DIC34_10620 [Treponema sp.]|nr:hypothetical protein [Treponema sp.]